MVGYLYCEGGEKMQDIAGRRQKNPWCSWLLRSKSMAPYVMIAKLFKLGPKRHIKKIRKDAPTFVAVGRV